MLGIDVCVFKVAIISGRKMLAEKMKSVQLKVVKAPCEMPQGCIRIIYLGTNDNKL